MFAHLMKKALTSVNNFINSKVWMISLVYCLVIAPTNILLKSFKKSEPSRSILSTSSYSEITSDIINLKSNEQCKSKVEWYNISVVLGISGSSACRKVLKLSNIGIADLTNMEYSLLTGFSNNLPTFFLYLGFHLVHFRRSPHPNQN